MNIDVQVFVCVCFFSSPEYVFTSRLSGLCDTFIFITFRGTAKLFSKVTIPYYFLPAMQETQFLRILTNAFFALFLKIIVILISVSWFLLVVLIYISLISKDVENIFICFLAIYVKLLRKIYFQIHCLFLIELSFCYWALGVFSIFEMPLPYQIRLPSIFSHSVGFLLAFLIVSFDAEKFLIF